MTVNQLIAQLKKLPPNLDVMIGDFTIINKVEVETFDAVPGDGIEYISPDKVVFLTN